MQSFSSITQYDKQFDEMFIETGKKGYTCSYFSLLVAWKFLSNYEMTQEEHNETVKQSINLTAIFEITSGMHFEELLTNYTNINSTNINATTVELINEGVIGFDNMFPKIENNSKYATIILKNEKYITVLVDKNEYKLRDCHESTQFNFTTLNDLIIHLMTVYQFTQEINVQGIDYSDYSSIEFIIINSVFESVLTSLLSLTSQKKQIFNPNGDVFDIPDNYMLSKADINYLEMLNEQMNDESYQINDKSEKNDTLKKQDIKTINKNNYSDELVDFD